VPWGLKRYKQTGDIHFITFSCYRRAPLLGSAQARDTFVITLERVRRWYGFYVTGLVVMPEHVHLLLSEPSQATWPLCQLKAPPSRKECEKGRAPVFICG
jgi:putative transposase